MTQILMTLVVYMFLGLYMTNSKHPKGYNDMLSTRERFIDIVRWPVMHKTFKWFDWLIIAICLIGLIVSYQI